MSDGFVYAEKAAQLGIQKTLNLKLAKHRIKTPLYEVLAPAKTTPPTPTLGLGFAVHTSPGALVGGKFSSRTCSGLGAA